VKILDRQRNRVDDSLCFVCSSPQERISINTLSTQTNIKTYGSSLSALAPITCWIMTEEVVWDRKWFLNRFGVGLVCHIIFGKAAVTVSVYILMHHSFIHSFSVLLPKDSCFQKYPLFINHVI